MGVYWGVGKMMVWWMDRRGVGMDGWVDGWMDDGLVGWIEGWMSGGMYGKVDGFAIDGWVN